MSVHVRLGIVFLMTVKPGTRGAVAGIVAGAVLGLAAALMSRVPRHRAAEAKGTVFSGPPAGAEPGAAR